MRPLALMVSLTLLSAVQAWPTGAGPGQCIDLMPGHGEQSTETNPYTFILSSQTYSPGSQVEVTIQGVLKALIIQARKADGSSPQPYGSFTVPDATVKPLECSAPGDTVTHASTDLKTDLKLTWTAPGKDEGDLRFIATLNEGKYVWWGNVTSEPLKFSAADGGDQNVEGADSDTASGINTASFLCALTTLFFLCM